MHLCHGKNTWRMWGYGREEKTHPFSLIEPVHVTGVSKLHTWWVARGSWAPWRGSSTHGGALFVQNPQLFGSKQEHSQKHQQIQGWFVCCWLLTILRFHHKASRSGIHWRQKIDSEGSHQHQPHSLSCMDQEVWSLDFLWWNGNTHVAEKERSWHYENWKAVQNCLSCMWSGWGWRPCQEETS